MGATLAELAVRFGLELRGDPDLEVDRVATLAAAGPGSVSFFANPKYRRQLRATRATAVVVAPAALADCPVAALLAANPYAAYARIAAELYPEPPVQAGVHPSAAVAADAVIDPTASIGAQAVIESGCRIGPRVVVGPGSILLPGCSVGEDTRLVARVTLYQGVTIGRRCVLHAGAVIGADGFGFAPEQGAYIKVPQVGSVTIGDDVEIGACTTVDRGAIDDTVIEAGVKLDNLVQVGHNSRIGAHTVVAGCVGISGSSSIGRRCMLGGAVGVAGHLEIGDDVAVTGLSLVSRSLPGPGVYSSGIPAIAAADWRRAVVRLRHLDGLFDRVARLEGHEPAAADDGSEPE